jgi:hypothetical protein
MARRGHSRCFFFALPVAGIAGPFREPRMQAALRARGGPAGLCLAQNPMLAALYFALPLCTNAPTEWTTRILWAKSSEALEHRRSL